MTPNALALLHAEAFEAVGRAWQPSEFASLLAERYVFLVTQPHGFALGRAIAGDAELLTIAVHPSHQRMGVARALLKAVSREARHRGSDRLLLEVAADNEKALALYRSLGFQLIAERAGYYPRGERPDADALVMELGLD